MNIKKWNINDCDNEIFYLESIFDNLDSLNIKLISEESDKTLLITFKKFTAYRKTDESERIETIFKYNELSSDDHTFFICNESSFLDWLKSESRGVVDDMNLNHYFISTPNDQIEILSSEKSPFTKVEKV